MTTQKKKLAEKDVSSLLSTLEERFEKNKQRHTGLSWNKVEEKLTAHPAKLWSLYQMEQSGGEPDVVSFDKKTGEFLFFDCSPESPAKRRNLCFDGEALRA